jgi:hypothetical protein
MLMLLPMAVAATLLFSYISAPVAVSPPLFPAAGPTKVG